VSALVRDYLDRERSGGRPRSSLLTPREEQVTKLIAEGHTTKEIAAALHISVKTVDSHRANVLQKLGMRDRLDLARFAIRTGLVEP
jgi:DNA-binding NarL/FixJ family response regulator